jgi:phosphate transport system protein
MSAEALSEYSLASVRHGLIELAALTEKGLDASARSLASADSRLAQQVSVGDTTINYRRFELEEYCYQVLCEQVLNAQELRQVIGTIKVATNLERVADYAADVAHQMRQYPHLNAVLPYLNPVLQMAVLSQEMVGLSVTAFLASDDQLAESVVRRDRELDELNEQVLRNIVTECDSAHFYDHLLFVTSLIRNYLRMGERAANICERAIYIATGELKEFRR